MFSMKKLYFSPQLSMALAVMTQYLLFFVMNNALSLSFIALIWKSNISISTAVHWCSLIFIRVPEIKNFFKILAKKCKFFMMKNHIFTFSLNWIRCFQHYDHFFAILFYEIPMFLTSLQIRIDWRTRRNYPFFSNSVTKATLTFSR